MRLVKVFMAGFIGLFMVITLLSLLIPSTVKVTRTTIINNSSATKVYEQVSVLTNWKNWHPVFKSGESTIVFSPPATAGNFPYCEIMHGSKSARISIVSADINSVKFVLQSPAENDVTNQLFISAIPGQNNVQVEWQALNKLNWYPWEKFYGIFIDKLTGPGYDAALEGLKTYLESQ
jgi:hypothetical protein